MGKGMSELSDKYEARVIAMLNTQLTNGVKDFGKIVDYIVITQNASRRYVFVTDTGRQIDASSAMRFMNAYRRKLANAPSIVYPEGTDTVLRRRAIYVKRSGSRSLGGTISNNAKIGDETINISSTVTTAGSFPEEYKDQYNTDKGK